jgi:hypothetical protein
LVEKINQVKIALMGVSIESSIGRNKETPTMELTLNLSEVAGNNH